MLKKGGLSSVIPLLIYARILSGDAVARYFKSQIIYRVAGKKREISVIAVNYELLIMNYALRIMHYILFALSLH